jgi:hypothetical protein
MHRLHVPSHLAMRLFFFIRTASAPRAVVPPADVRSTPEWAPGLHDERGVQRDGDSEQDQKHQARHRRNVRLVSLSHPLPSRRMCAMIWTAERSRMYRTVSTPFIYRPRARPARGIPPRLEQANASPGLRMSPDWRVHENLIAARMQGSPRKDIVCKVRCPPPPSRR